MPLLPAPLTRPVARIGAAAPNALEVARFGGLNTDEEASPYELAGRDVHLGGYSQGGMFCYQAAAYRRGEGIDSVITFGSPVDTRHGMPFGLPERVASDAADLLADAFRGWALPAWASRTGFRLLDPVKTLRGQAEFIMQLHDREALLRRERQRRRPPGGGPGARARPPRAPL